MISGFDIITKQTNDKSGWAVDIKILCVPKPIRVMLTGFFSDEPSANLHGQTVLQNRDTSLTTPLEIAENLKALSRELLQKH